MTAYGLDFDAGVKLWQQEIYGDWYRDPWAWPELVWIQSTPNKFPTEDTVTKKNRTVELSFSPQFHPLSVPKSRLTVRPAVIQDPMSRFIYLSATGALAKQMHEKLASTVYGWRYRGGIFPSSNNGEWDRYLKAVRNAIWDKAALQTDITSFFASIQHARLVDDLFAKFGKTGPIQLVEQIINSHNKIASRSGLPQRSFGSSLLANSYLSPIDDVLDHHLTEGHISGWTRWMDDLLLHGNEEELYSIFLEIQDSMRALGLEANSSKSRLVRSSDVVRDLDAEHENVIEIRFGGGSPYEIPEPNWYDLEKILRLEERVLELGPEAPRSLAKKTLLALRSNGIYSNLSKWLENSRHIPHAADALGRYLRDAGLLHEEDGASGSSWGYIQEWLVEYLGQPWSRLDWVRAQLALCIPAKKIDDNMEKLLKGWLQESHDIQVVAVASERLSNINKKACRAIINERLNTTYDPFIQRIFALALLHSDGSRKTAKTLLDREHCNKLTYLALDDNGWSPPPVVSDFDSPL